MSHSSSPWDPTLTVALAVVIVAATAPIARSEPQPSPAPSPLATPAPEAFHLLAELKTNARHSTFVQTQLFFPFPPSFIPPGETAVFQRTPDPGYALELQNVALIGEGEVSSHVAAKVEVHILDLYNRNPTSSDDRVFVREAWIRFGQRPETLEPLSERPTAYVTFGMAPRFSKILTRSLESYGLWATAVGRFEEPQLQIGGSAGKHVYWRAQLARGNPLFFRDTNVLAGDNGTPERAPGNVHTIFESGFPILYDAKASDLDTHAHLEWGAGVGFRHAEAPDTKHLAVDALGWYFHRKLADAVPLRGTFYSGDIKLLEGAGFPLPFEGRDKSEEGVNLVMRRGHFRLDGQLVRQDIAKLVRRGFDAELSALFDLNGLFLVGETPFGNWIRPVLRISIIDNQFDAPRQYPGLSVGWDWRKYDLGLRFGLIRDVDLTLEYSRHDMIVRGGTFHKTFHPDEVLLTLRVGLRP